MKKLCIFIILWSTLPAWIFAQNGVNFTDESRNDIQKLDIYLVIGQSNMAGRAEIRDEDSESLEGVYLFTGYDSSVWTLAKNPLNLYSTVRKKVEMQRLGPAYAFAKSMKAIEMSGLVKPRQYLMPR